MVADPLGPAFDTNTLTRPTQRKLVGVWMDDVGLPTLVLPQVQKELTRRSTVAQGFTSSDAWLLMMRQPHAPFRWQRLSNDQQQHAIDIRSCRLDDAVHFAKQGLTM